MLDLPPNKPDFQEYAGSLLASMTEADVSKTPGDLDPISTMLLMAVVLVGLFCLQDDSWKDYARQDDS